MNQMRELFEKWAKSECLDTGSVDGFYSDNDTHIAWGSWQAAQSVSVPVVGDVVAWVRKDQLQHVNMFGPALCHVYAAEQPGTVALIVQPATSISAAELEQLQQCEDVLRSLACSLSAGGYNADVVDPAIFEKKIRDGIDMLIAPLTAELDALRKDADSLADAKELLLIWQSWLGASRNQCDEAGKKLWDRIAAIAGEKK